MMKNLCFLMLLTVSHAFLYADEPEVLTAKLPANTWKPVEIDFEKTLKAYLGEKRGHWARSDGFCDNVYLPQNGNVLIRTGIECKELGLSPGFYSNTSVLWDLKTDTAQIQEVAHWGGGSYGHGRLLPAYQEQKTPSPRHTYDGICYVPDDNRLYLLLGAYGRMNTKASEEAAAELKKDAGRTWAYSFEKKRWESIDDHVWNQFKCSPYENHLVHWPAGKKLLFLNDNGDKYAQFDLATRTWSTSKLANPSPMRLYNARSTWDSKRSLWVFRLGPKLCTFNPETATFESLPNCYNMEIPTRKEIQAIKAAGKTPDPRLIAKGICYIAKHDRYLVCGPTGNDTAAYNPATKKWTAINGGAIKLINGYMQYNPELDLVAMNYQLSCFKFKYVPEK